MADPSAPPGSDGPPSDPGAADTPAGADALGRDATEAGHPAEAEGTPQPAGSGRVPSPDAQERMVEAMLFASAEPLAVAALAQRMPAGCDAAEAVARLRRRYAGRGVELARVGDAFAFRTAADLGFLMQDSRIEARRLSRAAVETLAIVAYHQPVTRTEIEELRGVTVAKGTLDQLIEIGWVGLGRRRMTPGRPATFIVTAAFLDHFGLASPADLPGLSELRAAGLLDPRADAAGLAATAPAPDMGTDDDDPPGDDAGDLFGET